MTRFEKFEKSQIAQPPVSQWKTLLALAYAGTWNGYQLSKKYEMKYPVVHRAIKSLVGLGWVKSSGKELTAKNVKAIKYGLTAEGVLWLLAKRPKDSPSSLVEGLWKEDARDNQDEGQTSAIKVEAATSEDVIDSVKQIATHEDVHMHLLSDLDVDRIAEKNAQLFPAVFGPWEIHRKVSMSGLITFSLPELAFSTLSECCYRCEGLLEKYGTMDQVFAYKVYKKVIEDEACIESKMSLESEDERVERVRRWAQDVSDAFPQFSALYKDIVLDLQKRFTESLSFTRKIVRRLNY